uniref:contractile injection system protein, VgrG/Pvc8 family n=1 Tax=Streptomyces exfoliatus TaxID=1905 RepID=UPI0004CAB4E4
ELDSDSTGTFTVIRASSKAHRLQRGRKVRAFRDMRTADIVRRVAAGAGLTCGRVEAPPITHKQLTQANVSDWEFLQQLAGESGARVRLDDKGLLEFVKPEPASGGSPVELVRGDNLLVLRAVLTGAEGADDVEVRGWNVDTKDFEHPGTAAIVATVKQEISNGPTVLFHDAGGERSQTLSALREVLPWLREQGHTFGFPVR